MANNFYLAPQVARVAVELAHQDSYLGATINRNFEQDILGGGGKQRVVNVRVPGALIARTRDIDDITNQVVMDSLSESIVSITLGTHAYSAVPLSEGDLTLNLESFTDQVLAPQVEAVVHQIETSVANAILATPGLQSGESLPAYDKTNPVGVLVELRRILRNRWVNPAGLNLAVGTQVYADLMQAKAIIAANESGSTAALREGNVGQVAGFQIVESNWFEPTQIAAYSRDAYTLAVRAPVVPAGATFGAAESSNAFSLRYIRDYDPNFLKDRSVVSTFAGVAAMPLKKVVRDYTANTAQVVDVPGGAAILVDTAAMTAVTTGA